LTCDTLLENSFVVPDAAAADLPAAARALPVPTPASLEPRRCWTRLVLSRVVAAIDKLD
jgi:hypothetical protein